MKKLNLNELAAELEVIGREETRKIKGGYDYYGGVYADVTIYGNPEFDNSDLYNVYGGSSYGGGGGGNDPIYNGGGLPTVTIHIINENSVTTERHNLLTITEIHLTKRDGQNFLNSIQDYQNTAGFLFGGIKVPYYVSQAVATGFFASSLNWGSIETKYINSNSEGLVIKCLETLNPYGYGAPSISYGIYTASGELLGLAN
jgi:hypothetical protein